MGLHTKYRAEHRISGLCILCHRPAAPYSRYCQHHLEYVRSVDRRRIREKRAILRKNGLCTRCGSKLDPMTDGANFKCLNCREQTSRRNRI
jgi:cell fate regulator YaaT (PSP1 superfamily)